MGNQDQVMGLFPIPLMICSYPFNFSKELEWINKQECGKPNRGPTGSGNYQSEDTFILDKVELKRVRTFIETKLNNFMSTVYGSKKKLAITQSWLNKAGKGESHHDHVHPNSLVSGVWYPAIDEQLPPIQFRNASQGDIDVKPEKWNNYNSLSFMLPLKAGELILFPSRQPHSVPVNRSDKERISLSFNTWPKGDLGTIDTLTYLPLNKLT